jgi:hypothetical protein
LKKDPARRRGDREQEIAELNQECLCGMMKTKNNKARTKSLTVGLSTARERNRK